VPIFTRTHDDKETPHADSKELSEVIRKYEQLFAVTPQRMRMIVSALEDTLQKGLEEKGQVVVGRHLMR